MLSIEIELSLSSIFSLYPVPPRYSPPNNFYGPKFQVDDLFCFITIVTYMHTRMYVCVWEDVYKYTLLDKFVVCLYMISRLTILHWATNKEILIWERLLFFSLNP